MSAGAQLHPAKEASRVCISVDPFDAYGGRRGWRPDYFRGLGERGEYGNPFLGRLPRARAIEAHGTWLLREAERSAKVRERLRLLRGKSVGCFCPPDKACHVDAIVEWVNQDARDEERAAAGLPPETEADTLAAMALRLAGTTEKPR